MEITQAVALNILNSRSLITEAGKYRVKVTSASPFTREDGTQTTIVNFAAMTQFHAQKAIKAYKEGNYEDAVNGTSITASQLNGQYVPSKGETVDIMVEDFVNKDNINILVVSSIIPIKAVTAKKFSLSLEEELVEEPLVEA